MYFSGLGYCVCERLINEFLTSPSRDAASHLVLTITTRSEKKTRDTLARLRKHVRLVAERHRGIGGGKELYDGVHQQDMVKRVHVLGTEVDLCDIRGVYEVAARIQGAGVGDGNALQGIVIPRVDVLIMNAGVSGYLGFNYPLATRDILTNLKQSVTWPLFLRQKQGVTAKPQKLLKASNGHTVSTGEDTEHLLNGSAKEADQPVLGEIFLANVFGHYLLAHQLMPLLYSSVDRPAGDRARLIWIGSLDALNDEFSIDDIQGLSVRDAYKSSKRLTDFLGLSSHLPGVHNASAGFFACEKPVLAEDTTSTPRKSKRIAANGNGQTNAIAGAAEKTTKRPEMYIAHPGICVTDIVSTWQWQRFLWTLALYFARWFGSIWHPVTPEKGACAPVWVALAEQEVLDKLEGPEGTRKGKWGTCTDFWGEERVRRTEVEGWGWDGSVRAEIKGEEIKGRKYGAVAVTKEGREEFEVEGATIWREMERLRGEWEDRLELGSGTRK